MNGRSESFTRWPWRAHDRSPERGSKHYGGLRDFPEGYVESWKIPKGERNSWENTWPEDRGAHHAGNRFGDNCCDYPYGGHFGSRSFTQRDNLPPGYRTLNGHISHQGGRPPTHRGSSNRGSRYPSNSRFTSRGGHQSNHRSQYPGSRNSDHGPAHSVKVYDESEPMIGIVEEPYEPSVQSSRHGGLRMIEWPGSPSAEPSSHSVKSSRHSVKSSHHSAIGSSAPTRRSSHGSRRLSRY